MLDVIFRAITWMAAEERNPTGLREFVSFSYALVLSGYAMEAELTVLTLIVVCVSTMGFLCHVNTMMLPVLSHPCFVASHALSILFNLQPQFKEFWNLVDFDWRGDANLDLPRTGLHNSDICQSTFNN